MHWAPGAVAGTIVAGGNGRGHQNHQLSDPCGIAMAPDGGIFVGDRGNNRVMHWARGAFTGTLVAGGHGPGVEAHQLYAPSGVAIAPDGGVFVADTNNNRVMHWPAETISREFTADTLRSIPNWTWVPWNPYIHRRWDFISHRTVQVTILCQRRGSHPGLSSLGNILVTHVLPFVIPRRLIYRNAALEGAA